MRVNAKGGGGASAAASGARKVGRPAEGRKRIAVPMEPEVLEVFEKMAAAAGIATGKCIADWCRDTADGAKFVMQKMVEARSQPKLVMRELEAMGAGMLDEVRRISGELKTGPKR